jgi:hypothetical protein
MAEPLSAEDIRRMAGHMAGVSTSVALREWMGLPDDVTDADVLAVARGRFLSVGYTEAEAEVALVRLAEDLGVA